MLSNSKTDAPLNTTVVVSSNSNPSIIVSTSAEIQTNLELKDQNVPNEQKFPFTSSDIVDKYVYQIKLFDENNNEKIDSLNKYDDKSDQSKSEVSKRKEAKAVQEYKININYNNIKSANDGNSNVDENNNKVGLAANNNNYFYSNNVVISCNGGIKRGCEDVDGETEDDLLTLSSSSLGYSKRSPPKKPKFIVTYKEMKEFFTLLNEESIREFLKRDSCCLISDRYALAMVFTYFKRAKFYLNEFTRINFYLALYLASDIEEDVDEYKYEIFPWALGSRWRSKFSGFLRKRDALLRRIGYRAIVSRKCCEEVMSLVPDHAIWKRERSEDHGGATRAYLINRSRRFLSNKSNPDEEELNLPRGPNEKPRPCPLCLVNRVSQNRSIPINQFTPSILKPNIQNYQLNNNQTRIPNFNGGPFMTNYSFSSNDESAIVYNHNSTVGSTINNYLSDSYSANDSNLNNNYETFLSDNSVMIDASSNKKLQKNSTTTHNLSKRKENHFNEQQNATSAQLPQQTGNSAATKLVKTSKVVVINQQTIANEDDFNKEKENLIHQNEMNHPAESNKTNSKLPSSNKFNKIKLSNTDFDHNGYDNENIEPNKPSNLIVDNNSNIKLNNLASGYNSCFMYKGPNFQHIKSPEIPANSNTATIKFPSSNSVSNYIIKDRNGDDIIDNDDDENDEVFSTKNEKCTKIQQQQQIKKHDTLIKVSRKKHTNSIINNGTAKKKINLSLSSSAALSSQTTINKCAKQIEAKKNSDAKTTTTSVSSFGSTLIETKPLVNSTSTQQQLNDQLVPREILNNC